MAAHKAGKLKPEHESAYFQRPRPVLELYDLDADPGELHNLAGTPDHRDIEQTQRAAVFYSVQSVTFLLALPVGRL